ncbi:NUDIX domain-containing protein [Candidatus Poribacteria bacterium]|nr:NUDIX domain-containing protein [Candidatus Poribacteria bacterium]
MKVKIIKETREFDDFLKVDKAVLKHEKFNGEMSHDMVRLNLNRPDAVAVLLYDDKKDSVILVKQFRYPAYVNNGPGWILELVAGIITDGKDKISTANAELMEEAGYEVEKLQYINTFYPSPGGSSEKLHLYLGIAPRKVNTGGGLPEEHEDIQVVEMSFTKAMEMIETGEICDAKTIIALQWLMLKKLEMED